MNYKVVRKVKDKLGFLLVLLIVLIFVFVGLLVIVEEVIVWVGEFVVIF